MLPTPTDSCLCLMLLVQAHTAKQAAETATQPSQYEMTADEFDAMMEEVGQQDRQNAGIEEMFTSIPGRPRPCPPPCQPLPTAAWPVDASPASTKNKNTF